MKDLIKYAIELDITNINTKIGYKGDYIISFSSSSLDIIDKIKKFCDNKDVQTKIFYQKSRAHSEIFCVFKAHDIYRLK